MIKALSARQNEIANLITAGYSTIQIARVLGLSPRTVETHIASIFKKLGVRSRVALTVTLLRHGTELVPPRDTHRK